MTTPILAELKTSPTITLTFWLNIFWECCRFLWYFYDLLSEVVRRALVEEETPRGETFGWGERRRYIRRGEPGRREEIRWGIEEAGDVGQTRTDHRRCRGFIRRRSERCKVTEGGTSSTSQGFQGLILMPDKTSMISESSRKYRHDRFDDFWALKLFFVSFC